jgi:hypothetical protein
LDPYGLKPTTPTEAVLAAGVLQDMVEVLAPVP